MAPDFQHLEPIIHAILTDLIPKGAYLKEEALLDVPGHWVEQLAGLVGDVGLPVMASDDLPERYGNTYRLSVRLRSLNGTGADIRLHLDLDKGAAADPTIFSMEGPDGKDVVPDIEGLRTLLAGTVPVPMPELGFVAALRGKMPGTTYQAAGDNVVRIGAIAPGFGLAAVLDLADEFGTTIAIPEPEARHLGTLGFVDEGRWALRARVQPRKAGPAPVGIPLAEGRFVPRPAPAVVPRPAPAAVTTRGAPAAPAPKPPKAEAPPKPAAIPTFAPPVPYREVDRAVAVLRDIVGNRSKSLTQTLFEIGIVARDGGTSFSHARTLHGVGNKHFREVWDEVVRMPLARVRNNELARAVLRALPDFEKGKPLAPALGKMRDILRDVPEGTTTAGIAHTGVRMLEAGIVVLAALDHAFQAPMTGSAGRRMPEPSEQGRGVVQCGWIKRHLAELCRAHLSVDHVRELAGVISPQTDLSPWKTVRDPLTWLFANLPDAKVQAMSLRRGEGAKGVALIELTHGDTEIRVESRYDFEGFAQATRAWIETPKGRVPFAEGDEIRPLVGLRRMAGKDGRSRDLADEIRGYEVLAGLMPVPNKADGLLIVGRLGTPGPDARGWQRLFALADRHDVTLNIHMDNLLVRGMDEELGLRRVGPEGDRMFVRDPAETGPGPRV